MLYDCDELTFRILTVQRFSWPASSNSVAPRQYCSLTYRVRGSGSFVVGGKRIDTAEGDVLYLPADLGYDADYSDNEIIVVHFLQNAYTGGGENYSLGHCDHIRKLFDQMLALWEKPGNTVFETNALFYQLLAVLRTYAREGQKPGDAFYRAVDYLNRNFQDPDLSLDWVSKMCGISISSLRMKFVQEFHMPPIKYLTQLRINYAKGLLAERNMSIEQIAQDSGFSDTKYFSRVIKKMYGVPPSKLADSFKA